MVLTVPLMIVSVIALLPTRAADESLISCLLCVGYTSDNPLVDLLIHGEIEKNGIPLQLGGGRLCDDPITQDNCLKCFITQAEAQFSMGETQFVLDLEEKGCVTEPSFSLDSACYDDSEDYVREDFTEDMNSLDQAFGLSNLGVSLVDYDVQMCFCIDVEVCEELALEGASDDDDGDDDDHDDHDDGGGDTGNDDDGGGGDDNDQHSGEQKGEDDIYCDECMDATQDMRLSDSSLQDQVDDLIHSTRKPCNDPHHIRCPKICTLCQTTLIINAADEQSTVTILEKSCMLDDTDKRGCQDVDSFSQLNTTGLQDVRVESRMELCTCNGEDGCNVSREHMRELAGQKTEEKTSGGSKLAVNHMLGFFVLCIIEYIL